MDVTVSTPVSNKPRGRKSWSLVWNDFTKERRADGNTVAICNHCQKQLTASSRSGTTHLKNHLIICTSDHRDGRKKRRKLIVRRPALKLGDSKNSGDDNAAAVGAAAANLEPFKFDHESSRLDLARMVILHRYPLSIVEDAGFRTFARNLQPRFALMSCEMVREDCMRIYENARVELYQAFSKLPCRVSITLDTRKSGGEADFVCLVGHFVDSDWRLQRKALNLLSFGPLSTSEDLAKGVVEKLHDWNIHKKLSFMVLEDNNPHDEVADELLKFLRQRGALLSNGDFFHVNSCAHVFNLIVQDGLEKVSDLINRVRGCVNYVKSSPTLMRRFQEVAKQVNAPQKSLFVDTTGSWTSTYSMLATASEFQDVFIHLSECDDDDSRFLYPNEWDGVKAVNECLDVFYQAMEKFSVLENPTANLYFNDICGIHLLLKTWCIRPFPVDSMASQMLKQFEEHWEVTGAVMAIASILDPRYKMKSIEYFFKLIYNSENEATARIEDIRKALTKIYNEYVVLSNDTSSGQALLCYDGSSSGCNTNDKSGSDAVVKSASHITLSDARKGLDQYLQNSSSSQSIKTDLDMYLDEGVHPSKEGVDNFDVLFWWKVNAPKYPVVSMMARDILATPLSITGLDADGRFPHQYLCSMDLITIQSLVCAHDWLKNEIGAANLDGDLCMIPANQDETCPLSQ